MTDPNRVVDLDLGCLYQFTDGRRGVIQAVGRRSGDYARAPFIRLDRDDRIGSSTGENIFVNMDQSAHFQRILIFVMVAGGSDDLTRTGATVTVYPTAGPALEIRLEGPSGLNRARSCAVAQIKRQGPEIIVKRELRYFTGFQSEIDAAYGWGLHWGPGPRNAWLSQPAPTPPTLPPPAPLPLPRHPRPSSPPAPDPRSLPTCPPTCPAVLGPSPSRDRLSPKGT
jgi:uncharacterized protein involved in tellurium resistance